MISVRVRHCSVRDARTDILQSAVPKRVSLSPCKLSLSHVFVSRGVRCDEDASQCDPLPLHSVCTTPASGKGRRMPVQSHRQEDSSPFPVWGGIVAKRGKTQTSNPVSKCQKQSHQNRPDPNTAQSVEISQSFVLWVPFPCGREHLDAVSTPRQCSL